MGWIRSLTAQEEIRQVLVQNLTTTQLLTLFAIILGVHDIKFRLNLFGDDHTSYFAWLFLLDSCSFSHYQLRSTFPGLPDEKIGIGRYITHV